MNGPFFSIMIKDADGNVIDTVPCDVSPSRRYHYGATVTDFPIEDGSTGTEHRKISPDEIEIDGMVSGSPLVDSLESQGMGLRGDSASQAQGSAPIPMQSAHDLLLRIHQKSIVVDVEDEFRLHENMQLTKFDFERTKSTGLAFDFQIGFKALKVVRTAAGALSAAMLKKLKKLSQKKKAGKTEAAIKRQIQTSKKNQLSKVSPAEATAAQADHAAVTQNAVGM
jgi:hypothetical protein